MIQIKFHDIGEGMHEGEIVRYFVNVGDEVSVDQPLVELQTDKMVAEIPAPSAGTIKSILYQEGEVVTVGTIIMEIETDPPLSTIQVDREIKEEEIASAKAETMASNLPLYNRVLAAPYTRKIAREMGIDIENIDGTGPAGRVLDEDVYRYANSSAIATNEATTEDQEVLNPANVPAETIPFTGIRKQIAQKMTRSVQTIPHVTHYDEVDVTCLLKARTSLKEAGETVSLAAFFVKATVICLKEFPIFNARLDVEKGVIRLLKEYHIGIATHTEAGLMVPVVHHAEHKSIRTIDQQMKELTVKAKAGKLSLQDLKQGTFTVNNVGPLGGSGATPIINYPETGIMTFYKTEKTPVVTADDEISIRSMMNISLTFDHRVVDGAQSIAFTNRFIDLIENPTKLLLELM